MRSIAAAARHPAQATSSQAADTDFALGLEKSSLQLLAWLLANAIVSRGSSIIAEQRSQ